jgi:hypothetical protein
MDKDLITPEFDDKIGDTHSVPLFPQVCSCKDSRKKWVNGVDVPNLVRPD